LLDSDLKDTIDTWNRKKKGSCLGQNLYILLVFSQRIPYAYTPCAGSQFCIHYIQLPFGKKWLNQISKGGPDSGKEGANAPPTPLNETLQ